MSACSILGFASLQSLHHGRTDNYLTCFNDMLYYSMFPGNLLSQLEILHMGQTYYQTLMHCSELTVYEETVPLLQHFTSDP